MCRLFGLTSGTVPVQATFWLLDAPDSLEAQSHRNADGSGIGFFDSHGAPVLDKQPEPAFSDKEFIQHDLVGARPLGGPIGGSGVGGARRGERLAHAGPRRAHTRRAGPARSFGGRDHRPAGPAGPPARRQPEHRHLSAAEKQETRTPDPMRVRGHSRRSPDRIRTGVTALRGRRPRPLDDGAERAGITGSAQTTASATVRPTGGSPLLRRTSADVRFIRAVS